MSIAINSFASCLGDSLFQSMSTMDMTCMGADGLLLWLTCCVLTAILNAINEGLRMLHAQAQGEGLGAEGNAFGPENVIHGP